MSALRWVLYGGTRPDDLGFLPLMLDDEDPRPAAAQLDETYAHGGGWRPFGEGQGTKEGLALAYPGDALPRPAP
jgi:hypothetical protein